MNVCISKKMSNFAAEFREELYMYTNNKGIKTALDGEVMFVESMREMKNLATMRTSFNTVVFCRSGRILAEVGGLQQIKVQSGQLLLIPHGKLVQPMLVSTDLEASVLLVSDHVLKTALGNQINIWNRAMYTKELYVVEEAGWLNGMEEYARAIFQEDRQPKLFREVFYSFLRTMLLMICESLINNEEMQLGQDESTTHDKELFNRFLQLLGREDKKHRPVSYYSEQLNITPKYLSTICKRVSGKTPLRWITDSVMEDCYQLLTQTDLTVKEISNMMGFPNSSFFGQYFRDEASMTPIEYRNEHKGIR